MILNLSLSVVVCVALIALTYIIIINSIFLEKIYIKSLAPVDIDTDTDTDTDGGGGGNGAESIKEGLTNREYYSLLNSIQTIDQVDPSSVFLTSDNISIFSKTKGNPYYNNPIKFLDSYDNTNILNYIDGLLNINNTTDKNFNKLAMSSKGKGEPYSKYSCFINMKQYLKQNAPKISDADMPEDVKALNANLMTKRVKNGAIEKNLKFVIKNKLTEVISVLYSDYGDYITKLNGKISEEKRNIKSKLDKTVTTMNNRVVPLESNVTGYLEKLQTCVKNLLSLKPDTFWDVISDKTGGTKKKYYTDKINAEISKLRNYIESYNKINTDKIKNPSAGANNIPVSVVSTISGFSKDLKKNINTTNIELDNYANLQKNNYDEFLLFYESFNNTANNDFISTIEHEYLSNDYGKKVNILLTDINKYDNAVRKMCVSFEKKCDDCDNKLKIKCNSLSFELNELASKTNIVEASKMYVEYEKKQEIPKKPTKKKKKCTIS